jgi:hypothetical protein
MSEAAETFTPTETVPTDSADAISAREAARTLSNYRWERDRGTETPKETAPDPYKASGHTAFTNMEMAVPIEAVKFDDPPPVPHPGENPVVIDRVYQELGGSHPGRHKPLSETVTREQAASDLSNIRAAEADALRQAEDQALADAMNTLLADGQQPQQAQPQAQEQPQAVEQQGDIDLAAEFQKSPKLLAAVQEAVGQYYGAAEQARQQYQAAMANNAAAAAYSLVQQYPELQGIRADQIPTAIQVLAKSNPQRAQEMVRHLEQVRGLVQQHQQAQVQQAQAYQQAAQQNFERAASDADARYHEWSSQFTAEHNAETTREAMIYLKEELGLSEKQIVEAWNTGALRSYEAQRLLHDAARYRMLGRGLEAKRVKAAPQVQRPGSPMERGSEEDYSMRKLNARLDSSSGRDQLRAAAELVATRRRNARR